MTRMLTGPAVCGQAMKDAYRHGREDERSAGAAPLDVGVLPSGARLSLQKGDDYGNGPWYAVVENTIDLPDQDTARLGSGETPQEAMDTAISRFARLAKGTDR